MWQKHVPVGFIQDRAVLNILHQISSGLHLTHPKELDNRGGTFELKRGTMAILCENDQRSVIFIPAGGQVVLIEGDIERDSLIKIQYRDERLLILSEDLRRGISLGSDPSRS